MKTAIELVVRFAAPRLRPRLAWLVCIPLILALGAPARAQTDQAIYGDGFAGDWQSWSWAAVDPASTAVVHTGSISLGVTATAWSALSLHHTAFDSTGYGNLTFWIHGGPTGGQRLHVTATLSDAQQAAAVDLAPLAANTWQQITIPLAALGVEGQPDLTAFQIQEWAGVDQPTFYIDDVVLTGSVPTLPPPPLDGMALYQDALVEGWQNWSWATVNTGSPSPVNSGSSAIAVTAAPYTALSFHHTALRTSLFSTLTFWINGGSTGGQVLTLFALRSGVPQPGITLAPLAANTWQEIVVPLADLGVANQSDLTDFWLQESAGVDSPTYYVDDVRLDFAPLPAVVNVAVDARRKLQTVDPRMFAMNAAIWDGSFNTPTTVGLLTEAANRALRFPGGSASDTYHWQTNTSEDQTTPWATDFDAFAATATATRAQVYVTVNYGTGTPEEAAAWVRYANRTKRYGVKYWEIGNENYGTWEADNNTRPHDPVTYATRFKEFVRQMKAVDRSIKIGAVIVADEDSQANYADLVVTNPRTGQTHSGWTAVLLATFKQLGVVPDFVVYHRYEQAPGAESDFALLDSARTWPNDAAAIRQMLNDYLGRSAACVEIDCTENNSVYGSPGKQTTSLVNGLFLADSLGSILQTEFKSCFWWDFRNGQEGGNNNSPFLYGWRHYGDYGIVNYATPAAPADRYPTFQVFKLLQHFARGGEKVVAASSDHAGIGVYAVRAPDDSLRILLINKNATTTQNTTIAIAGMKVDRKATVFTYGMLEDDAARTGTGSPEVQQTTINLPGATFTYAPEPYSVTVIRIRSKH